MAGSKDASDELAPLHRKISEQAIARSLTVCAGVPGGQSLCWERTPDELTLEEFLDLAVAGNAVFLFLERDRYEQAAAFGVLEEAGELADELVTEGGPRAEEGKQLHRTVARLRKRAAEANGWISSVNAAFCAEGVLFRWTAEATWYEEIQDGLHSLFPEIFDLAVDDSERQVEEEEIIERRIAELLQLERFRKASPSKRSQIANKHHLDRERDGALPAEVLHDQLRHTINWRALAAAEAEEEQLYVGIEARLPELAAQLLVDPDYLAARSPATRKHRLVDFLEKQARGYPTPSRTRDLMADAIAAAEEAASKQKTPQGLF